MTTLRQALYGAALLGALALLLWGGYQRLQAEQGRSALAQEKLANLTARSNRQAATIIRLGGEVHAQRLAQQSLQQQLADLRQAHAGDQLKKQEIRRNDPSFSSWGAQPLPGAARRLHARPGFTGADDYRQWLPGRHGLHPQSGNAHQ
ncbi:TPA: DUF2570 domain-containing protein [Pseudomonas aeruginosa]